MTICIYCPPGWQRQRSYACEVVFGSFLGISWVLIPESRDDIRIQLPGMDCEIAMPDSFFGQVEGQWMTDAWLPRPYPDVLVIRDIISTDELSFRDIPVLFGKADFRNSEEHEIRRFPIDIIGTAFYLLSAYEEMASDQRDAHGRFLASMSCADKCGYLDRPLLDETLEVFWLFMTRLWPGLERVERVGETVVTCDVDRPFDPGMNTWIGTAGRLLRASDGRGKPRSLSKSVSQLIASKRGDHSDDELYTFPWYMDECERAGRTVCFHFIADRPAGNLDCRYNIFSNEIIDLLRLISDRSHLIQMHGSYESVSSLGQMQKEKRRLSEALERAGSIGEIIGNRQHYLRWEIDRTPDYLDKAGYVYDTTGSYADKPGFKYGTARPFPMWSWKDNRMLRLVQKPLICMECSVISEDYMGLGYSDKAFELMHELRVRATRYGGDFTLLWHNSHLSNQQDRHFFRSLIA